MLRTKWISKFNASHNTTGIIRQRLTVTGDLTSPIRPPNCRHLDYGKLCNAFARRGVRHSRGTRSGHIDLQASRRRRGVDARIIDIDLHVPEWWWWWWSYKLALIGPVTCCIGRQSTRRRTRERWRDYRVIYAVHDIQRPMSIRLFSARVFPTRLMYMKYAESH